MAGFKLTRVDRFTAINFVANGIAIPVCRREVSAPACEDGALSSDNLETMLECLRDTIRMVNPPRERRIIEYKLVYTPVDNAWTLVCYL